MWFLCWFWSYVSNQSIPRPSLHMQIYENWSRHLYSASCPLYLGRQFRNKISAVIHITKSYTIAWIPMSMLPLMWAIQIGWTISVSKFCDGWYDIGNDFIWVLIKPNGINHFGPTDCEREESITFKKYNQACVDHWYIRY